MNKLWLIYFVLPKETHLCNIISQITENQDFIFPPNFHFSSKKTCEEGRGENAKLQVKVLPCLYEIKHLFLPKYFSLYIFAQFALNLRCQEVFQTPKRLKTLANLALWGLNFYFFETVARTTSLLMTAQPSGIYNLFPRAEEHTIFEVKKWWISSRTFLQAGFTVD